MKKFIISLISVLMLITSVPVYAEDTTTQETQEETHLEHEHAYDSHNDSQVTEQYNDSLEDEGEIIVELDNDNLQFQSPQLFCNKEEHTHNSDCYNNYKVLICENDEEGHIHTDECFQNYSFLVCNQEEHIHTENCYDENYQEPEVIEEEPNELETLLNKAVNNEEGYYLSCNKIEHKHTPECFQETTELICQREEFFEEENYHQHTDECYDTYYTVVCNNEEHTHDFECIEQESQEFGEYIDEIPDDIPADDEIPEDAPLVQMLRAPLRGSNDRQIYVRSLFVQVFKGGVWQDDKYVKTVPNSATGQRFAFRINFALSGVGEIDPYDVENPQEGVKIVVPKQILRNRLGNLADSYEMSIPHISEIYDEELDPEIYYCYYEEDDNIVIVNFRERPAGDNGYIEMAFSTTQTTFNYEDMCKSDDFFATIYATNNGEEVEQESNHIPVYLNTTARITSTYKQYPTKYDTWQSSWGAAPADANDYFYFIWQVRSNIDKDTSQPYNLTFADTTTSSYGASEFVAYKFRGQFEWTTNNTITDQTITGDRYDSVLTRHLKSDFAPLDYWTVKNKIEVELTPVDGLDPKSKVNSTNEYKYQYHEPVWYYPTGHFQAYKYADGSYRSRVGYNVLNLRRGKFSRYDLQDWKSSELDIYDTFDWGVIMEGYPYPWTIDASADRQDVNSYGVTPVTFEVSDNTLFLGQKNDRQLTWEDYEIDTLNYSWTKTRDAIMSWNVSSNGDTSPSYSTKSPVFEKDTDIIYFYAELKNSGDFVLCATHDLRDNSVWFDPNYVASIAPVSGSQQIVFVDNITGYKVKFDSSYYYTNIELCLNAHLKHSNYIDNYCSDKFSIMWGNTANARYFDNRGETPKNVFSGDRTDWNYASETVIERHSDINKRTTSATNITKKRLYEIGWKVDMYETIKINEEPTEYVEQDSGIFYDLLPAGSTFNPASISVRAGSTYLRENEYKITQIPNYRDTGRILLTVEILTGTPSTYEMYYSTIHPWDSIKDFGEHVYNPVAYETGNPQIYNGRKNDGGSLGETMANLGVNGNTEPKFLYSSSTHNILALTSAISGLTKKVKNDSDKNYTYDTTTKNNGAYSYRLRYQTTFGNTAKNLIFFDSLENYIVDSNASDWYGTIESFDVAQLRAKGIEPVIYLSEVTNFDLEQYNVYTDFSDVFLNSGDWVRIEDFGDLSRAKAFAIDCRKKTDGSEFILGESESIQAVVYMRAPAGADDINGTGTDYPETYNNIYIRNTITGIDGEPQDFYIHQDYTTVRFVIKNDISLEKVSSEDSETKLKDIKFRLAGKSDYGTEVDEIKTTDKFGKITFEEIEKGRYILQEYETTKDWLLDTTEHIVVIDSEGKVFVDEQEITDSYIQLENDPRIYADVPLQKRREGDGADDIELKQILANANTGDEVEYNGETYIVRDKTDTKVKLEKPPVKYAVSIYGIGQDTLSEDGGITTETAGLTFGPATGANYINSYKSHTPSGTTILGNEHRCIHNDDWNAIIYWNRVDPYVYEQCIGNNCTHSVDLALSDTLKNPNFKPTYTGDGPSQLFYELTSSTGDQYQHLRWNPINNGTNYGGWGASRIRAMLNGADSLTMEKGSYSYYDNLNITTASTDYTSSNVLISAFPEELQAVIGSKAVLYDSVYNQKTAANLKTSYDKLWLLSPNEMADSVYYMYNHSLEAPNGKYQRFTDNNKNLSPSGNSYFYSYRVNSNAGGSSGRYFYWWLRSFSGYGASDVVDVSDYGSVNNSHAGSYIGVSPCFSLSRTKSNNATTSDSGLWVDFTIKPQTPISNTTFKLSGTSDYGNEIVQILTTNSAGKLTFEEIEQGTYELVEVSPNEDFILNETKWIVTISEDRSVSITSKEENRDRLYEIGEDENTAFKTIYNEPRYWSFTLRKIDKENTSIWLEGATFTLKGISDLGTNYDLEINSDANGRVVFDRIEKGTYLLKETAAPANVNENGQAGGNRNYIADSKQYIVEIDCFGNVKIEGLTQNEYDDFEIKNDRALDGKITIIKKWEDNKDPDGRPTPVVHLSTGEPEGLSRVQITYDANGGYFESTNSSINKVVYKGDVVDGAFVGELAEGEILEPVREGYEFVDWYLDKDCTTVYAENISDGRPKVVYAKWRQPTTKYAVQIYGIGQDVDVNNETMGLTFGPALGQDFMNTYISHTPSGNTALGNVHRCVHDDTWEEIVYWNNVDPYVYEQCVAENCTHSVELSLSDTLKNPNFVYGGSASGDGVGILYYELYDSSNTTKKWQNLVWNPINNGTTDHGTNKDGWGASRIRAMMNGYDELTMLKGSYSYHSSLPNIDPVENYIGTNTLLAAFPQILQDNIGARKTLYDSVYNSKTTANLKTSYDKLWLLSPNEMSNGPFHINPGTSNYLNHPLEAPNGKYQKFIVNNLDLSPTFNNALRVFRQDANTSTVGSAGYWWLRSLSGGANTITYVSYGGVVNSYTAYNYIGVSPCFALSRTTATSSDSSISTQSSSFNKDNNSSILGDFKLYTKVYAEEGDIASGVYDGVDWRITAEGELIIGKEVEVQEFVYKSSRSYNEYPWYSRQDSINSIRFDGTVKGNGSMQGLFSYLSVENIDLNNFDTSKVTDMGDMFRSLKSTLLDLSSFDTSNVTNMSYMFCASRVNFLNLTSFNTSKVTDMQGMFNDFQTDLLDLNSFDTSKVKNMRNMFSNATTTAIINKIIFPENFGSAATEMNSMFNGSQTTILNLSNFNTSNVTNMAAMFYNSQATSIDLSSFDTSNVTDMRWLFQSSQATTLDLGSFDTSKVIYMDSMFSGSKATTIIFSDKMTGNNGERLKNTNLSEQWIKVNDKNGNKLYDQTIYTGEQVRNLNETTTPTLSGTWMNKSLLDPTSNPDGTYTWTTIDSFWIDNGDGTWTYTFDVFDDNLTYYFWEEDLEGYESDIEWIPGYKVLDGSKEKIGYITNRSTDYGSLKIEKEVEWYGNPRENLYFDFNIQLEGNGIEGRQVFSDVIFNDGHARVKLKDGENVLIQGLPAGITYRVEEIERSDFTTQKTGDSGTIESQVVKEAKFINSEVPYETLTSSTQVTLRKQIVGIENQENYTFYVEFTNLANNTTYYVSNGDSFTSDANGYAFYEANIGSGTEITFEEIPYEATYQVTEAAGEYISSFEILEHLSVSQDSNSNSEENKQLSTAKETLNIGDSPVVIFTNTFETKQNLKIKKEVIGTQEDKSTEYELTIELEDLVPGKTIESDAGRFVADEDGYSIKTITLKDGEEFNIYELPLGSSYKVTESANNCYASYGITDANNLGHITKSFDINGEANKSLSTDYEIVDMGEDVTVKFVNYSQVTLKLIKKVSGNMGDKSAKFNFDIELNIPEIFEGKIEDLQVIESKDLSHDDYVEYKIPYGTEYAISEDDYSSQGYKTYINNGLMQSRELSDEIKNDTEVTFRNVNGVVIPTGIKIFTVIPLVSLIALGIFLTRKKKERD